MTIELGSIVEGVVTGTAKFGAFVQMGEESGLVHISEISNDFVKDVNDYVKEGDKVKVKVISRDNKGKIGLSMKQALTPEEKNLAKKKAAEPETVILESAHKKTEGQSFDDMLSQFMKDSNEKIESAKQRKNVRQGKTRR
ncbi:MAG: S1 RNA-binding domain-containing protein [Tissierellia bacterium]|nr:S1 RNA-binding domain-containing protein [Tissierellia bacterium]